MVGYKIENGNIIHDFSKDKKRALKLLEDEKKAREAMRAKHKDSEEVILPQYVQDIMDEVA